MACRASARRGVAADLGDLGAAHHGGLRASAEVEAAAEFLRSLAAAAGACFVDVRVPHGDMPQAARTIAALRKQRTTLREGG